MTATLGRRITRTSPVPAPSQHPPCDTRFGIVGIARRASCEERPQLRPRAGAYAKPWVIVGVAGTAFTSA